MTTNDNSNLDEQRAEALRRHQEQQAGKKSQTGGAQKTRPEGLIPVLAAWAGAACEVAARPFRWVAPLITPVTWVAKGIGKGAVWHWNSIAYKKDKDGARHFSPRKLAAGLAIDAVLAASSPVIAMGVYYHATEHTYTDVFIPNAGVFVNQQFLHPSQAGKVIAPRDEIFTVLGQRLDEKNRVEPIRFDIDSNLYFIYKPYALRPDLLAAKLVPTSPYGAMCSVQATGLYTRLPRILRANVVKWLDLRTEIVGLKGECVQLEKVPAQYSRGNAPALPDHFRTVKASAMSIK